MSVRDPTEAQGTGCSDDVKRSDRAKIGARQMEGIRTLQRGSKRTDDRHFQSVQYSSDPKSDEDEEMEPTSIATDPVGRGGEMPCETLLNGAPKLQQNTS